MADNNNNSNDKTSITGVVVNSQVDKGLARASAFKTHLEEAIKIDSALWIQGEGVLLHRRAMDKI